MALQALCLYEKSRNSSVASAVMKSRERTLQHLYMRRTALDNLIRSLETYDRLSKTEQPKVVVLR